MIPILLALILPSAVFAAAPAVVPLSIEESALDRSVNACEDFYSFACGGWLKKTEIPPDRSHWARSFSEIDERNAILLRTILEHDAREPLASASDPYAQKLGDFYGTCMDEEKAETASLATLKQELAKIDQVKNLDQLARLTALLQLQDVGAFFVFPTQ